MATTINLSSASFKVKEGIQYLHIDDQVSFVLDVSDIATTPTTPSLNLYHSTDNYTADVASTYFVSETVTINASTLVLPEISGLLTGVGYSLELKFDTDTSDTRTGIISIYCL